MRRPLSASEYYHVRCFERIADLTDSSYLARIQPVTRANFLDRGLSLTNADNYIVDAGAERLVLSWIETRQKLIRQHKGMTPLPEPDQVFADLLFKAGLSGFEPQQPTGMSDLEFTWLSSLLAPNESDGPDDMEPWNLFKRYLHDSPESLEEKHGLYDMLHRWRIDRVSWWRHLSYQTFETDQS